MEKQRLKIGITHGDVNGIGCELVIKTLMDNLMADICESIIYGSSKAINLYKKQLGIPSLTLNIVKKPTEASEKKVNIIHTIGGEIDVVVGEISEATKQAAITAMNVATEDLKKEFLDAVVYAPMQDREVEKLVQKHFGYGGILMFLNRNYKMVSLDMVDFTVNDLERKFCAIDTVLKTDFCIRKPRIAIIDNLFEKEEKEMVNNVLKKLNEKGLIFVCANPEILKDGTMEVPNYDAFIVKQYDSSNMFCKQFFEPTTTIKYIANLPALCFTTVQEGIMDFAGKNKISEISFRTAFYWADTIKNNRIWQKKITSNPLRISIIPDNKNKKGDF